MRLRTTSILRSINLLNCCKITRYSSSISYLELLIQRLLFSFSLPRAFLSQLLFYHSCYLSGSPEENYNLLESNIHTCKACSEKIALSKKIWFKKPTKLILQTVLCVVFLRFLTFRWCDLMLIALCFQTKERLWSWL